MRSEQVDHLYSRTTGHQWKWCRFYNEPQKICFRWNCRRKECRDARFEFEKCRQLAGLEFWLSNQPMWYITICPNVSEGSFDGYSIAPRLRRALKSILDYTRRKAKRNNQAFAYFWVTGTKSVHAKIPYEPHIHMQTTWIPEHISTGSKKRKFRVTCPSLEKIAAKYDLTIWIEECEIAERVTRYCGNNLQEISSQYLPNGWQRSRCSNNWYPLTESTRKEFRKRAVGIVRSKPSYL